MKIAIIGAGAIGGLVGVKLAHAGEDVTFLVRGANLAAIRANGMKLIEKGGGELVATNVRATCDYTEAGVQDVVILALKAQHVEGVVADLVPLLGAHTTVVTMQNGIPFWYFQKHGGEFDGRRVESVDPTGAILAGIAPERIIGCVVYPASELIAPGVVRHIEGDRFPLGEPDGAMSERVQALAAVFAKAGFKAPVLEHIRDEIWLKLWGNLTFNPISALSHSTLIDICQFPLARELATAMMTEAQTVACKLGITFRVPLEVRIAGAEKVGRHKTSMLQDIEAGRGPEIDALVGSVIELARLTGTPTPHINAVYALVKLLAKTMGEANGQVKLTRVLQP